VLRLLTDANISQVVAHEIIRHEPRCRILSIHEWQGGRFANASDAVILDEAHRHGLTLVTRDVKSVGRLLDELYLQGRGHSGVIFVNRRRVPEGNVGVLVGALIRYWRSERVQDWTNRTAYLPV
jgi:hypothetical protein